MAKILVVDDDADVLGILSDILVRAGRDAEAAPSGLAALAILDVGNPVDLLLTDIVMPGLHGFNLARMARSRRPSLKILYISGFSEAELVARDPGDRFGKLLNKPIMPGDLRREVDAALTA